MTAVVIFHHALGLTDGLRGLADTIRTAGHTVCVPDLFNGETFASVEAGVAHAESVGFDTISDRGAAAADDLDGPLVTIGFSLGVIPSQRVAQTRPDVVGAVLCHAALPSSAFGGPWPEAAALEVHISERDPWAEEDVPAAEALVSEARGELFLYEGTGHLIADPASPDYDAAQADLLVDRVVAFIDRL